MLDFCGTDHSSPFCSGCQKTQLNCMLRSYGVWNAWTCQHLQHILQGNLWLPKSGREADSCALVFMFSFQRTLSGWLSHFLSLNTRTHTHTHTQSFQVFEVRDVFFPLCTTFKCLFSLGLHILSLFSVFVLSNITHFHDFNYHPYPDSSYVSVSRAGLFSDIKSVCPIFSWYFPFQCFLGTSK